jgi:hypothetical protein
MGQTRRSDRLPTTSGLPGSTDIARPARLVHFVPRGDIQSLFPVEINFPPWHS